MQASYKGNQRIVNHCQRMVSQHVIGQLHFVTLLPAKEHQDLQTHYNRNTEKEYFKLTVQKALESNQVF